MDTSPVALEPELPICDPHHHLMDNAIAHYSTAELLADLHSGHNVVRTMYMECGSNYRDAGPEHLRSVGEVEFVVGQKVPDGVMEGVVAYADLRLGDAVEEVLDALDVAGKGRTKGIRFCSAWHADPAWRMLSNDPAPGVLRTAQLQRGAAVVERRGLPIDCWMYADQLLDLVSLANALPQQVFVLDHCGTPLTGPGDSPERRAILADWRRSLAAVAACDNVVLKVGGIGMAMQGAPWTAQAPRPTAEEVVEFWAPEISYCIETFRPDRCMFESNFPIDRPAIDYVTLWNAFKVLSREYSENERAAMFHDNAVRVYHLDGQQA